MKRRAVAWFVVHCSSRSPAQHGVMRGQVVEIGSTGATSPSRRPCGSSSPSSRTTSNRTLRIEADGDEMFRASELSLERRHARSGCTHLRSRICSAGYYTLRAQVLSTRMTSAAPATQEVVVTGAGLR